MMLRLRIWILLGAAVALPCGLTPGQDQFGRSPEVLHRLPPIDLVPNAVAPPSLVETPIRMASDPMDFRMPQEILPPETPPLAKHKNGFFQKLSFTATEVFPDGSGGLGLTETQLYGAFALPAPTTESPLLLVPTWETTFVQSPDYATLPRQLYAAYFDLIWLPKITPKLTGIVSLTPGWYTDFEGDSSDGLRWTGRLAGRYDWSDDRLQILLGVLYLDRYYARVLPIAGVIWKPTDDWNLELVFPKAKLARRLGWGCGFENWAYLGGGFGGNDWSVLRSDGVQDLLVYRDWRITLGWEQKRDAGAGFGCEAGFVFYRDLEYVAAATAFKPDETFLLRGFLTF